MLSCLFHVQVFRERERLIRSKTDGVDFTCFATSIWDETLYTVRFVVLLQLVFRRTTSPRLHVHVSVSACFCIVRVCVLVVEGLVSYSALAYSKREAAGGRAALVL